MELEAELTKIIAEVGATQPSKWVKLWAWQQSVLLDLQMERLFLQWLKSCLQHNHRNSSLNNKWWAFIQRMPTTYIVKYYVLELEVVLML